MWSYPQRWLNLISLLTIFSAEQVVAENYALVIGGSSKKVESKQQEFARVIAATTMGLREKGYQVTTLFGSGRNDDEKQKYQTDYQKIASLQSNNMAGMPTSATATNIDNSFEALITKAKPGDKVEIFLSAHGSDTCEELGPHIRIDTGSQCKHTFTIFDQNGKEIQYPSDKMIKYLKRLEDKGALPSIILNSCHSGRAKSQLKNSGLVNTCAYFQTAGNELGYGCFEDDPDFANDFTSTGEYLAMRYYVGSLQTLEKDPYFSKSACFQKTVRHYRDENMNLSSVSSAYWSSRKTDSTFQSPTISSLLNFPYFTTGLIQPQIIKEQNISCEPCTNAGNNLIRQLSDMGAQISDFVAKPYYQALNEYNEAVERLKSELEKSLPETPERLARISSLQQNIRDNATKFMLQERNLIDSLFRDRTNSKDPCTRSL